jgi:hypothetical protein
MKTVPISKYPPADWPRSERLRKPYTFHPVRVVEGDTQTTPRDPNLSGRDYQLAVRHLKGPIHPHLLRLQPGSYPSIERFVEQLGFDELMLWGMGLDEDYLTKPWHQLGENLEHIEDGFSTIPKDHLERAWCWGSQQDAFEDEQGRLRQAFDIAQRSEHADEAIRTMREATGVWPKPDIRLILWPFSPDSDEEMATIVETPADIFARAWLELYDELQDNGIPSRCPTCGTPFIGRDGQVHCTRDCQLRDYGQRRRGNYRRGYERMYQRMRRGTITPDEFEAWKKRQGRK